MGRHSASYLAVQQRLSAGPTAAGAATYVGRVGSLALALGIGAAVAGGAGIANAEGPADNSPDGSAAQSSQDSTTGDGTAKGPATVESPTARSHGVKTRKSGLFDVPKMKLHNGRSAATGDQQPADGGPGSLPDVIAGIPPNMAAALFPHAPAGASGASTSPPGVRPAARVRSRASTTPTAGPTQVGPTATGDATVDPFVRRLADEAAAAGRGDVQTRRAAPSPTAEPIERKLANPRSTTTAAPMSVSNFAASAAPTQARPVLANPIATVVSGVLSALGFAPSASSTGDSPVAPMPMVLGVLQLIRRELELISLNHAFPMTSSTTALTNANPAIAPGVPAPTDEVPTAYGDIGKWMLESNGQISDYGGQPYGGKTLLEPVNVIIVDPTSKSPVEAAWKLNAAMFCAGFPAQPIHSTGFQGSIDDVTYGQQPTGLFLGFSDNLFIFPNDHGRIFGPDPVETSTGYVWTGAFSTEQLGLYNLLPTHTYVSSNMARNALAMHLILSGKATYGGIVPLDNSYNTATTTTGDHDGYAVVLVLE
jgi:hypothetical protein